MVDAGLDEFWVLLNVGEIQAEHLGGIRPLCVQGVDQLLRLVDGVSAVHRDADSALMKAPDDGRADAARAPRDQRHRR